MHPLEIIHIFKEKLPEKIILIHHKSFLGLGHGNHMKEEQNPARNCDQTPD